jgi:hypothetical protein
MNIVQGKVSCRILDLIDARLSSSLQKSPVSDGSKPTIVPAKRYARPCGWCSSHDWWHGLVQSGCLLHNPLNPLQIKEQKTVRVPRRNPLSSQNPRILFILLAPKYKWSLSYQLAFLIQEHVLWNNSADTKIMKLATGRSTNLIISIHLELNLVVLPVLLLPATTKQEDAKRSSCNTKRGAQRPNAVSSQTPNAETNSLDAFILVSKLMITGCGCFSQLQHLILISYFHAIRKLDHLFLWGSS